MRRGNLAERNAPDGWIPTVTSFPRNDKGGTPTLERTLFQGVLINGMCNFKNGTRAATAAQVILQLRCSCGWDTHTRTDINSWCSYTRYMPINSCRGRTEARREGGDVLFYSTRCHALAEEEQIHEEAGKFFCVLTTFFYYNIIISTNISILRICVRADVLKRWQIIRRQL